MSLRDAAPVSYHLVWITALLLLTAGICTVLSVSLAQTVGGGDKYLYVRPQGLIALAGLVLMVGVSRIDYRKLRLPSVIFVAVVAMFLVAVHIPGVGRSEGGASSWIGIGPVSFQPSEFAKLAVILFGAHLLSSSRVKTGSFMSYMWPFGLVGLALCALVMSENDLGTSIIIVGLLLGLLWIAGMKSGQWLALTGAGIGVALAIILTSQERVSRITALFDPSADAEHSTYQLWQSLVALGRGGWYGVGRGGACRSSPTCPRPTTT